MSDSPAPAQPSAAKKKLSDMLARAPKVESRLVGEGGSTSALWQNFDRLRRELSDAEVVELLGHQSPVVRVYMVWEIVERRPNQLLKTYPLLTDAAIVSVMSGDELIVQSVGKHVLLAWREYPSSLSQELGARAAKDSDLTEEMRGYAQRLFSR